MTIGISHRLSWADTDSRHIISMKLEGFVETPQDIVEEYNGCSVPKYTRYPLDHSSVMSSRSVETPNTSCAFA